MMILYIIPLVLVVFIDLVVTNKKGYPTLSIVISNLYYSERFKWLTYNIYGDESWFYEKVNKKIKGD